MSGDRIIAHQGATVINRSKVENAFNNLAGSTSPDVIAALKVVANKIEESANPAAGVIFERFAEEVQKPQRDHKTLRSYWETIVGLVPDVVKLSNSVGKIASLFGGV